MDLRAGCQLRAPTPHDLEAVADVLEADDLDDAGQTVLDADFLRDQWNRLDFDLATDAWVVVDGAGAIVAYGQAMREEPTVVESWGMVLPEHRGRGIGSSLLDRIEGRASELLAGLSAPRFRHFWHMQADLDGPFEPGPAPVGIEITGIEPLHDLPAVHAVLHQAFADHWGHHSEPYDRWAEEQTGSPSYDPTLWRLATEGGQPVAALTANVLSDRGWIDQLGVLAPCRGRGIGAALLHHSFATFAVRGLRRVLLNVDAENPTGATALYERAGMRVVKRWDLWERGSSKALGSNSPS